MINYSKSTFIPMHVTQAESEQLAATLGCPILTFPQPYLGLPLSPTKLRNAAFLPLISKVNKYLAGWKGRLLSTGGRLVLTNAVLTSVPVYHMCFLPLPKGVIASIDRRRCAFLWTGDDTCSGAKCLIAWDKARKPKSEGGLGIRDLAKQNQCLLLRFIHKFYHQLPCPWQCWLNASGTSPGHLPVTDTFMTRLIADHLQPFRALTRVHVHRGNSTSLSFDDWTPSGPLCLAYPALFSHTIKPTASVAAVLALPLSQSFQARLITVAAAELSAVRDLINNYGNDSEPDDRTYVWDGSAIFSSSAAYRMLATTSDEDDNARLWSTHVPNKLKFFAWLLCNDRLPTRCNLLHKNILDRSQADCPGALEHWRLASTFSSSVHQRSPFSIAWGYALTTPLWPARGRCVVHWLLLLVCGMTSRSCCFGEFGSAGMTWSSTGATRRSATTFVSSSLTWISGATDTKSAARLRVSPHGAATLLITCCNHHMCDHCL